MNEKRTEFKKLVIEAIHGLPYEEIIKSSSRKGIGIGFFLPSLTIGRVMQALGKIGYEGYFSFTRGNIVLMHKKKEVSFHTIYISWKLTKENGQECTDDDQTDETIEALLKLKK